MRAFPIRWLLRSLALALLLAWAAIALWQSLKPLPPGVHIAGAWRSVAPHELLFLRDLTAADATGAPLNERQINAELLRMVAQARDFLVLDTGLFGDLSAAGPGAPRLRAAPPVATALAEALLQAKQQQPGLQVLLLIDPASVQMSVGTSLPERLRAAGIAVVAGDADRLRAPNAAFAALWQLCCRWWSPVAPAGAWPNPVGVGPAGISMGLWGRTQGYQRSHRQLLIGDDGAGGLAGLIFSRPLSAEAALHSAVALHLTGEALEPLLDPAVELLWWERGEWDCHGREAVLSCLRERVASGVNGGEIDLAEAGEDRHPLIRAIERGERLLQLDCHRLVDGIELFRPVDRDHRNRPALLDGDDGH